MEPQPEDQLRINKREETAVKLRIFLLLLCTLLVFTACDAAKSDSEIDKVLTEALQKINMPPTVEADLNWADLTKDLDGVTVTFTSSDNKVIDGSGRVHQTLEDQTVTITAKAVYEGKTKEKTFTVRVPGRAKTVEERIAQALGLLELPAEVTADLELPATVGETGVLITWQSDNPEAITSKGIITPNGYKGEDKTATLTATVQLEGLSETKTFAVTVKAKGLDSVLPTVQLEKAELTLVDGKVILTLEGLACLDPENSERTLTLAFDKEELQVTAPNIADTGDSRAFRFTLDISSLNIASGQWKDLNVLIQEAGVNARGDITVTADNKEAILAQSASTADGKYVFKEWNGSLKINREPVLSVSKNSNETVYVTLVDGRPILVVTGSVGFSEDPSLDRTITLELRENRLPDGKLVCQNLSTDPDTRVYRFEADLTALTENGLGNGDWVNLFLLLTEGERTYEGDLTKDDVVCDSNAPSLSTGYRRYYFEKWENFLKVVTSPDESIKESNIFLNSTDAVRLEQEGEDVYLILQGTAYISNAKLDVLSRTIRLKVDGGLYFDNQYQGDGDSANYYFKIRLNDYKNVVAGLRIEVTEVLSEGAAALTKDCEIKQAAWNDAAGSLVSKPASGMTAVLTPCGVYTAGDQVYSLIVDEWNNIKFRAANRQSVTVSALENSEDIYLELGSDGSRLYLVIRGTAYIDENASGREIRLAVGLDPKDYVYENLEAAGGTAFRFEVDVTGFGISDDWYKFKIQVTEGDTVLTAEFPQGTYTGPLTDNAAQWENINGKRIGIKYEWSQVYLKVEVAN